MVVLNNFFTSALLASAALVLAHPGHNIEEEAAERREFLKRNTLSVRSCMPSLKARGLDIANMQRRRDLASTLRNALGLTTATIRRRDFSAYNFSHQYNGTLQDLTNDESAMFSDNSSCTLQTEVTQGPYYVNGELIRQNITDGQTGVPLFLDIQVIDTSTCQPATSVYMDFWHCNATGVYSGVVASGNGDSTDTSNLNATFLRGIHQTDANGTVQFHSIFPGHYTGRATHIHVLTHSADSTVVNSNNTLLGDDLTTTHASHVGQLFFDQSLIAAVEATAPYSTNTQSITQNSDDQILAQEAGSTDPFVEYIYLGDSISDGVLAWISIGINSATDNEVSAAATLLDTGAIENSVSLPNEDGPGGPTGPNGPAGGPGSNGTMTGVPIMTMMPSGMSGMPTGYPTGSNSTWYGANATSPPTPTNSVIFATATGLATNIYHKPEAWTIVLVMAAAVRYFAGL